MTDLRDQRSQPLPFAARVANARLELTFSPARPAAASTADESRADWAEVCQQLLAWSTIVATVFVAPVAVLRAVHDLWAAVLILGVIVMAGGYALVRIKSHGECWFEALFGGVRRAHSHAVRALRTIHAAEGRLTAVEAPGEVIARIRDLRQAAETLMGTLIAAGDEAIDHPDDYAAHATLLDLAAEVLVLVRAAEHAYTAHLRAATCAYQSLADDFTRFFDDFNNADRARIRQDRDNIRTQKAAS